MIYFRLCFSFSCSGYDLTLIKKSHTLNLYSFLLKFLFKNKTLQTCLLVTAVGQFIAKTTKANSEKAFYFLSLMSCSINKLKSHMFFPCKNFTNFLSFPVPPPFLYGPRPDSVYIYLQPDRLGLAYFLLCQERIWFISIHKIK